MFFLFSAFLVSLFWFGYWVGWNDAKQQSKMFKLIDRLYKLAKRGIKLEANQ